MVTSILENRMGVVFKDKTLLSEALTHRSYINEHRGCGLKHNERLEYLGDAVLELIVSKYLFDAFPDDDEGELTQKRCKIVCGETALKISLKLGVERFLLFSKGEAQNEMTRARGSILADAFEALVGALYADRGYTVTEQFIHRVLLSEYKGKIATIELSSPKCRLQDAMQKKHKITPLYLTLAEEGPDHDKKFTVGVYLNTELLAKGAGTSKQGAEEDAATKALILL